MDQDNTSNPGDLENGMSGAEGDECSIHIESNDVVSERFCRICHLSSKESCVSKTEVMELGCGCRGEIGFAHSLCAEAWFRIKGNRLCEICGEGARNVRGVGDDGFMEEWKEGRCVDGGNGNYSSADGGGRRRRRCLQGQPFCNLLMACLVIAFILPWFFRVNLF